MPLLDLGYRAWNGERTPRYLRFLVVAATGIMMIWRGYWLRTMLALALAPALFAVFGFFTFEQGLQDRESRRIIGGIVEQQFQRDALATKLMNDPDGARHDVWAQFLLWFFRYPQVFWMVVVLGVVAPRLISYDLRSRAYLLFLSRPLSPAEYLLGKAMVLWFLLSVISTVPALLVYVAGILISPDWTVVQQTWDLPFRILLATLALALPTSAIALFYSSMTTESRFAGFAWFATWILGWVTYTVLTSTAMFDARDADELLARWQIVSPYHTLGQVQAIAFGAHRVEDPFWFPLIACIVVTLFGFFMAHRRISGVLRI